MSRIGTDTPMKCPHGDEPLSVGACVNRYLDAQMMRRALADANCRDCPTGARVRACLGNDDPLPAELQVNPNPPTRRR